MQYVVQKGDTLTAIARRFSTTVTAILAVNPQITNPDIIFVGQIIIIPTPGPTPPPMPKPCPTPPTTPKPCPTPPTTPKPCPTPPPTPPPTGTKYVVQRGDTLSSIARRFGTTVNDILAKNPQIKNPNLIYPGQIIIIPG